MRQQDWSKDNLSGDSVAGAQHFGAKMAHLRLELFKRSCCVSQEMPRDEAPAQQNLLTDDKQLAFGSEYGEAEAGDAIKVKCYTP